MNDEFNKSEYVNAAAREMSDCREFQSYGENRAPEELTDYGETVRTRRKRRRAGAGNLLSLLTAAVASVVFVVALAPALTNTSDTAVDFAEIWSTDTSVGCVVKLENRSAEGDYKLVVYNDFTVKEQNLAEDDVHYETTGLKPNMYYNIAVKNGAETLSERRIRTKKPEEMPVTEFRSVTHECTCNVDGYFKFTMDFIDENGYWYDFGATLTDSYGTTSRCRFAPDPHAEQKIDVIDGGLMGLTATFKIECASKFTGGTITLYETEVQI